MQLHSIVEAIALRLFSEKPFSQTDIAKQLTSVQSDLSVKSESAYKRAVARLHACGLIELVNINPPLPGNVKFYRITRLGIAELSVVERFFKTDSRQK
jgi:DNA-binding PadR family transcriptional regulator